MLKERLTKKLTADILHFVNIDVFQKMFNFIAFRNWQMLSIAVKGYFI